MQHRRTPRSRTRAEHWVEQIRTAASGRQALSLAWNWVLSEQQSTRQVDVRRADAACWELALNVALYAARMRRARIAKRAGLTDAEVTSLLNPWAADTAEGERQ